MVSLKYPCHQDAKVALYCDLGKAAQGIRGLFEPIRYGDHGELIGGFSGHQTAGEGWEMMYTADLDLPATGIYEVLMLRNSAESRTLTTTDISGRKLLL